MTASLPPLPLPDGIRSRSIPGINGLEMHILEAGHETAGRPCLLLLHGFPELAFSWRKVMVPLAQAGYHVVAPDHRGYGRTTGWDAHYDGDLRSFGFLNLARDTIGLVDALGLRSVAAVVGHDFGSPLAAWCALIRPDVFPALVMMSAPFGGPPALPGAARPGLPAAAALDAALAALSPPRKHYQWYYSGREAEHDMLACAQGFPAFLRAYYHHKSADWAHNRPFPLASTAASEFARLPTYYVMRRDQTMAETVAEEMPDAATVAACHWLTDEELAVYAAEFTRTGLQGGLQWYRCGTQPEQSASLQLFSGRTIDVPATFIAGESDWGIHQKPGELDRMARTVCTRFEGIELIPGAGHWVQQEQPTHVVRHLLAFLGRRR